MNFTSTYVCTNQTRSFKKRTICILQSRAKQKVFLYIISLSSRQVTEKNTSLFWQAQWSGGAGVTITVTPSATGVLEGIVTVTSSVSGVLEGQSQSRPQSLAC